MPPAGGFEAIRYKRNLPVRGPGALAILAGVTGVCAYGFYRVGLGNLEKKCVAVLICLSLVCSVGSAGLRVNSIRAGHETCRVVGPQSPAHRGTWPVLVPTRGSTLSAFRIRPS
jgi:hypothetical protein